MKFIISCYKDKKIVVNRGDFIVVSLQKLRNNNAMFEAFSGVFRETNIVISNPDLKKIYLRIAKYAFRAYTRAENNKQFNGVRALASGKTNIAFRTQVQSGCIGIKDELAREKKTSEFDHI